MEQQLQEQAEEEAAGTATFPRGTRSKGGLVTMPFVIGSVLSCFFLLLVLVN